MKANQKPRQLVENEQGFSFIVPMTLAIIVGFAALAVGTYIVGTVNSTLQDSLPQNTGDGDYRDKFQNASWNQTGDIMSGFGDIVDIEVVVIIITALSMAILAVMAVGSRRLF